MFHTLPLQSASDIANIGYIIYKAPLCCIKDRLADKLRKEDKIHILTQAVIHYRKSLIVTITTDTPMKLYILTIVVALFAVNMGGGNFAASFAAAYGGRLITKRIAQLLFLIFVVLGALLVGRPVAHTLGSRIIPSDLLDINTVIIISISATISLAIANVLRVPQSTSMVSVGAILGVGLYYHQFYAQTFWLLIPFWLLMPILGYLFTYLLGRMVYPPRRSNFWIYEKLVNHRKRLALFVIIASCYNAFSVGTNNVSNAVGPLVGAGLLDVTLGLAFIAPMFGCGGVVFDKVLTSTSDDIVPLGLLTATIICFVCGSLMIVASLLGIPQSFVMIKVAAVIAISGLKDGHAITFRNPTIRKTCMTWMITPFLSVLLSYIMVAVKHILFD